MPLISICIPAYERTAFLERLLDSIAAQTYSDFEVIISDDSKTSANQTLIKQWENKFDIKYYKNQQPLGTPANWNFAIAKSTGKWIKLMHDDDWFVNENSLQSFANAAMNNSAHDFIFSGFIEMRDKKKQYMISAFEEALLKKSPLNLFKKNFIGHPSTTLIKNNRLDWYDEKTKWVVDFEFYMRCLNETKFIAIKKALINIGIHESQVTKTAFGNAEVEIPECLYLLNMIGVNSLKNVFVYDYYWRLFRNLKIRNFKQLLLYSGSNELPTRLKKMLQFQFNIPLAVLKIGIFSKLFMLLAKIFT